MGLQVQDIVKTFGEKTAVDHLSFALEQPGVFGLIGTNGAGKTTTIRMLLGILTPDSGAITWNGGPIRRDTVSFGYMPEERGIYMKTKVLEQLVYFGMLRGMNRTDAQRSALSYLDRLGMGEYRDMPAEKLSKGNQQKIQLIATLVHDPDLVVLDEPFSGLDPLNTEVLRGLIRELVDQKKYVVLSSHQMATVEEYCENLVLLHRGKAVLSGNLRKIKASYGHTNLVVSCGDADQADALAREQDLALIERRADESEYTITGDAMANAYLSALLAAGLFPTKYEIREPSLHEIFIEKVGDAL